MAPDHHGRVTSTRLGLSLGIHHSSFHDIEADWLRWFDGEGNLLLHGSERAAEEARRADDEARRADEEARRADDEAQRAAEQARQAAEQAQRADDMAALVARYEARFGRLDGALE